jgi:hypothetical protein
VRGTIPHRSLPLRESPYNRTTYHARPLRHIFSSLAVFLVVPRAIQSGCPCGPICLSPPPLSGHLSCRGLPGPPAPVERPGLPTRLRTELWGTCGGGASPKLRMFSSRQKRSLFRTAYGSASPAPLGSVRQRGRCDESGTHRHRIPGQDGPAFLACLGPHNLGARLVDASWSASESGGKRSYGAMRCRVAAPSRQTVAQLAVKRQLLRRTPANGGAHAVGVSGSDSRFLERPQTLTNPRSRL